MGKDNVVELKNPAENNDPFLELLRTDARNLNQQAIEVELQQLLANHAERRTAGVARIS